MVSHTLGKTPVAVFVFNRPEQVLRLMACISYYKPSRLLVVADGPRPHVLGELALCEESRRRVLSAVTWPCQIQTCFSEENMGCGKRLSSGLDWVFSEVPEAIVLEDDCLPSRSFFYYCEALLARYRDVPKIMHIGGYRVPFEQHKVQGSVPASDYSFSDVIHVWGWATWRRAWQHYDFSLTKWPEVREKRMAIGGLRDNPSYWTKEFDFLYHNKPHTWDHQWSFACWLYGGKSIIPRVNLVQNTGFGQGAHGSPSWHPLAFNGANELVFPLQHSSEIRLDLAYGKHLQRWVLSSWRYLWYLLYWLRRLFTSIRRVLVSGLFLGLFFLFVASTGIAAENTRLLEQFYRGQPVPVIRSLEKKAGTAEEKLLLANAYFKAGQFSAAESIVSLSDYYPLSLQPFVLFLRLQLAVKKKDLVAAQRFYTAIVRIKGEGDLLSLRGAIEIAACTLASGQKSEAGVLLRTVLRKTNNPEIKYLVERLFFDMALDVSDKEAAKSALRAMCLTGARLREEPSWFKQYRLRFGEDVPQSFVFSDNAVVLNRAGLLIKEGLFQEVVDLVDPWLVKGVAVKSDDIQLQYMLAQAYYFKSEYRLARAAFERILFLEGAPPEIYWPVHMRLVECLLRTQLYEDALRYIQALQAGPEAYRSAGQALYIRYLMDIKYPAGEVLRAVQAIQKLFPNSPDVKEVALDAWYYAFSMGYSPMPDPPMFVGVSRFLASWHPKHFKISADEHILAHLPLGYTALALLEATTRPGVTVSADKRLIIAAGFGQLLLSETSKGSGYKDDLARAKVLALMERPYQSITLLRTRLLTAPRDSALWKTLDADWAVTLFPRIMPQWIADASQVSGLDPNLILSVIRMESTFNTEIKSRAGALGLMQLMPATAREVSQRLGSGYQGDAALLDPAVNITLGSFYLAEQLRIFKGSLVLALAAYNAGPSAVRRWIVLNPDLIKKTGKEQLDLLPYSETRRYVSGILDGYVVYSFLEKQGL